jgi:hypothetical protein
MGIMLFFTRLFYGDIMTKSIFLPSLLLSLIIAHKAYASLEEKNPSRISWTTLDVQKTIEEADESIKQLYILLEAKREIDPVGNPTAVAELLGLKKPGNSNKPTIMNNSALLRQMGETWTINELEEALAEADPSTIELYMGLREQNDLDPSVDPTAVAELLGFKKPENSILPFAQNISPVNNRLIQTTTTQTTREAVKEEAKIGLEEEENAKALLKAVGEIGGLSGSGISDPNIYGQSIEFAREMATNYLSNEAYSTSTSRLLGEQIISHAGSEQRFAAFRGKVKEEILATATARTLDGAAKLIVQGWFNSPDHKDSMMNRHNRFGYALVRTDLLPDMAGYQWFAVGLFADD